MTTNFGLGAPQQRASRYSILAVLGQLEGLSTSLDFTTVLNSQGSVAQVSTLTVSGATDSKTYSVIINGNTVSVTVGTSQTTTTVATAIAAAIVADPFASAYVLATSSTNTVILTGRIAGDVFTVSEDDAQLSWAATTAAVGVSAIAHGRAIFSGGTRSSNGHNLIGGLPASYTAQVDTLAYTYNSTSTWQVSIEIDGQRYSTPVLAQATSKTASTAAMLAEVNLMMPANTVVASAGGSDELVLTAEVAGASFVADYSMSDGATTLSSLTSTRSLSTSMADSFVGILARSTDVQSSSLSTITSEAPANAPMDVLQSGRIFVARDSAQTPAYKGKVYCDAAGLLYTAASSARVLIPQLSWELSTTNDLALVRVAA